MTGPLDAANFNDPSVPLVNNVDARLITSGSDARAGLIRQITSPVRWMAGVELMQAQGVETFVEVGPGKVLCGLMRQIDRSKKCLNVEDGASFQRTLQFLAGV